MPLSASGGLHSPAVLAEGGVFGVQGKVQSPTTVTFGFSTLDVAGVSAHRYCTRGPLERKGEFDLILPLAEFGPRTISPWGQQLVNWFCLTIDRSAALEITSV